MAFYLPFKLNEMSLQTLRSYYCLPELEVGSHFVIALLKSNCIQNQPPEMFYKKMSSKNLAKFT